MSNLHRIDHFYPLLPLQRIQPHGTRHAVRRIDARAAGAEAGSEGREAPGDTGLAADGGRVQTSGSVILTLGGGEAEGRRRLVPAWRQRRRCIQVTFPLMSASFLLYLKTTESSCVGFATSYGKSVDICYIHI